jgi:hypothetical protein
VEKSSVSANIKKLKGALDGVLEKETYLILSNSG